MRPCQFCGSEACEWNGAIQLGCTDCGYDMADVDHIPLGMPYFEDPLVDADMWNLTNSAATELHKLAIQACAGVFVLVGRTA